MLLQNISFHNLDVPVQDDMVNVAALIIAVLMVPLVVWFYWFLWKILVRGTPSITGQSSKQIISKPLLVGTNTFSAVKLKSNQNQQSFNNQFQNVSGEQNTDLVLVSEAWIGVQNSKGRSFYIKKMPNKIIQLEKTLQQTLDITSETGA